MWKPIAQFLLLAIVCLPAHAQELNAWIAHTPPTPAPTAEFRLAGQHAPAHLRDFVGKPVVLNFWATWCTPCLDELPTLAALAKRYRAEGLVVLAMSVDTRPFDAVQDALRRLGITMPLVGHDPTSALYHPLRQSGLPMTVLINRKGEVVYHYEAATDWLDDEHAPYLQKIPQ